MWVLCKLYKLFSVNLIVLVLVFIINYHSIAAALATAAAFVILGITNRDNNNIS
jgi:hypothetical protein